MTKKTKVITIAALIILTGYVSCVQAQEVPVQDQTAAGSSGIQRSKGFLKELDLSAEQIEKLRSQRNQNQQKIQELRKGLREKQRVLKEELQKRAVDRHKINMLAADIKAKYATVLDLVIENAIILKETLTPQQIQKIKEKIQERRQQRQAANKLGLKAAGGE